MLILRDCDVARFCRFRTPSIYWIDKTNDIRWGSLGFSTNEILSFVIAFIIVAIMPSTSASFPEYKSRNCKKTYKSTSWDRDLFLERIVTVWTCSKEMISFEFVLRNVREGKAKEFLHNLCAARILAS